MKISQSHISQCAISYNQQDELPSVVYQHCALSSHWACSDYVIHKLMSFSKNNPIFYSVSLQSAKGRVNRQSLEFCMEFRTEQEWRILLCKADSPDNSWEILSSHTNLQFFCSFPIFYCALFPPFVYQPVKCFLLLILVRQHIYTAVFASCWELHGAGGPAASWLHFSVPCCRVTSVPFVPASAFGHSAGQLGCRHTCMCSRVWFTDLSCVLLRDVNNHHLLRFPPTVEFPQLKRRHGDYSETFTASRD